MKTTSHYWLKKLVGGPAIVTRCLVLESSEYRSLEALVEDGLATRRGHAALPAWEYTITQEGLKALGYENSPIDPPQVGDRREGQPTSQPENGSGEGLSSE